MSESAPLLRDTDDEETGLHGDGTEQTQTFSERVLAIIQEPLTPLTVLLLVVSLVFLLLSSIFIGLFAGAQHRLNTRPTEVTVTKTYTTTQLSTTTTTAISVTTTTERATTTAAVTKTSTLGAPAPTKVPEELPCLTSDCIILASEILKSLDWTKDPCEDFYDFATGGWNKNHPLPADKARFGAFDQLAVENKQIIRSILENTQSVQSSSPYDDLLLSKIRNMYQSCMNEPLLEELGAKPLRDFAAMISKLARGEGTIVDGPEPDQIRLSTSAALGKRSSLTAAIAFAHTRGIPGLFNFEIEGDVGVDSNFMVLQFEQPSLGLPSKEYYEEESIVEVYESVVARLLATLSENATDVEQTSRRKKITIKLPGNNFVSIWPPWPWPPWDPGDGEPDKPRPDPPRGPPKETVELAKEVVEFEKKIAAATLDLDILQSDPVAIYNPYTVDNFTAAIPSINFPVYFASFTPRNLPDTIVVNSPSYLANLSSILEETRMPVIEAYLITRAALRLAPNLGQTTEAWQAVRVLTELLTGVKKGAVGDRSEFCVGKVEQTLGFAAGRFFVEETFGGKSKEVGTKIVTDVIEAFKSSLEDIPWMDKKSAKAAVKKADALRVKVGYPLYPNTTNPRALLSYYQLYKISNDTFFENVISSSSAEKYAFWQRLGKRRNVEEFLMWPSMVNAYFNPPANEIVFPAGIMRPPFFSVEWPSYLSYGSFGEVASHELTHAFDSSGRMFDDEGRLRTWWTNATSEGYNERQKCIVDQYANYTVDDGKGGKVHLNGNLTSGENIGDSGIIQAFRAWKKQSTTKSDYLLPGLTQFSREQMFFISFARSNAQRSTPQFAVSAARSDPHSPPRYRVEGTVRNLREFGKAWKCPVGTKLNPPDEERCLFWS